MLSYNQSTGTWNVLPKSDLGKLFATAGLSDTRVGDLPFGKLEQAAVALNSGSKSEAKALFGDGKNPGNGEFSVTQADADKLTAAHVVLQVVPRLLKDLDSGDPSTLNLLTDGEFVALGSRLYQQPSWLSTGDGQTFISAWFKSDDTAALDALTHGRGERGQLEAAAYKGVVNDINLNLRGSKEGATIAVVDGGHWEDRSTYDLMSGVPIVENKIWVPDGASTVDVAATSPTPASPSPSTLEAKNGVGTVIKRSDGGRDVLFAARADSPDGLYKAGDKVTVSYDNLGEYIGVSVQHKNKSVSSQTLGEDPGAGERTVTETERDSNGKIQSQITTLLSSGVVTGHVILAGVMWQSQMVDGVSRLVDPNGLTASERIQQSYDQETERLQNRSNMDEPETVGLRTLTSEELRAFEAGLHQANSSSAELGILYADAVTSTGGGTLSDAGSGGASLIQDHPVGQAAADASQSLQAAAALGLINTLIGLQHWDQQSDLSHLSTAVAIYNQINSLSKGSMGAGSGLGNLGSAGAALGFLSALESGSTGGIVVNGIGLADAVFEGAASKAIAEALNLGAGAADGVVPGIGFLMALNSGNPVSIASSGLSLLSTLGYIGPWGAAAGVVLSILGGMLEETPDLPMQEGQAHASWDGAGNLLVSTTKDEFGGGATATGWMNSIAQGLQHQLASQVDAAGQPIYSLVPQRLPSIGYQYDPDGFNYQGAPGHMVLKWIDDAGAEQTRYYDGAGNRNDGSEETLAADFIKHAQSAGAIVPSWEAQTILAHWNATSTLRGLDVANIEAREAGASGMPQEAADHLTQVLSVLTFLVPSAAVNVLIQPSGLIDIDGDGYLEESQWLQVNQAALAIDRDGDGIIAAGELLSLNGAATSRNSLSWLDANGDGRLDASDPAFAMLRVWLDMSQDGTSQITELQNFSAAGIEAIVFNTNPPTIVHTDGTSSLLTEQHLTGEVLGVRYAAVEGGLIEAKERGEVVLHAINTRAFDGDPDHTHGGDEVDAALDGDGNEESVLIGAQDIRLTSTTARTLANRASANALATVVTGASTVAQAMREATASMVRSSDNTLFGTDNSSSPLVALALGAGAMQWPMVASASTGAIEQGTSTNFSVRDYELAASTTQLPATSVMQSGFIPLSSLFESIGIERVRTDPSAFEASHVGNELQVPIDVLRDSLTGASSDVPAQPNPAQPGTDLSSVQSTAADVAISQDQRVNFATSMTGGGTGETMGLAYPSVRGELVAGTEDIGLRISAATLLANDSTFNTAGNPARPMLTISAVSAPRHGQVGLSIGAQGETAVIFLPDQNYYGSAGFSYTVTDQYGLSATASVSLDLAAVNDAPDAKDDSASGDEDHTLAFNAADLLANDSDVDTARDGDLLRITRVGVAEHGTVFLDPNGAIRFVPVANYNGPAQFTYWVGDRDAASMASGVGLESPAIMRLTLLPVNDLPVVTGESIASDEDVVLNIAQSLLLANDTDVDVLTNGQVLRISAVSGAQHGTVVLLADGTIQFNPERDYFGAAGFTYMVDDGNGGQVAGTAVINLASINDVPVVNDELLIGKRDAIYTLTQSALLANDTDVETPQGLSIVAVLGAMHGGAHLNADGSVTFTPDSGYAGRGSFQYVVQDADGGQATGITEIDFSTVNMRPVAVDDSFTGFEDTPFVIQASQLLVNDLDPDAGSLASITVDAVRNAVHGTVSLQPDGSVRFVPAVNFFGTASFEYRVSDGEGGQTWASAFMNVQSVNDAPVIEDIFYSTPIYGYRGVLHSDGEGGASYEYTPVTSEAEARGLSQSGTLYLQNGLQVSSGHYLNGQLRPIAFDSRDAMDDVYSATFDDPFRQSGRIVAYDPDGDSAAITFSIGTTPQHGHAWTNVYTPSSYAPMRPDQAPLYFSSEYGAWQYYSHLGDPYSGSDPFSIRVTDGTGASTDALIYSAHSGSPAGSGGGGSCPIVVDLNGDGIQLISAEDSNMFADVNGDGWRERIGWAANGDGVLTFDANQDGRIDLEEVTFAKYKPGARTDLEGLAGLDSNGDGQLTSEDAVWTQLGVLNDKNGNGQQEAGELQTLNSLGISGIDLHREGQPYLDHGNVVFGLTNVSFADGHIGKAADVMFAGEGVALSQAVIEALQAASAPSLPVVAEPALFQVAASPHTDAEADLARMALVFNQYCAASNELSEPVSYVNWAEAGYSELPETDISSALIQADHLTTFGAGQADIRSGV